MLFTGSSRILQLHPTRRCNLRCLHCYSDSSPEATDELPLDVATAAVRDAAALGYDVLSVSGGEPFVYPRLAELLACGRAAGMRTQVISNGLPITAARLGAVRTSLDLLAVSIDGGPEEHDRMRALDGTFHRLTDRLRVIADCGVPFGLLFTLTMFNVHQLEWAAELAAEHGARLLQVHPLEASGRAAALADEVPDETEAAVALLEALRLQQQFGDRLAIHVDITTAEQLRGFADSPPPVAPERMADAVSPLVVEPDGECVPLEYGFPRSMGLGNVRAAALTDLAAVWLRDSYPRFRKGLVELGRRARLDEQPVVVNAYGELRAVLA